MVDITGRTVDEIRDREEPAGRGEAVWQPRHLADGVYFIRVETAEGAGILRVVLIR